MGKKISMIFILLVTLFFMQGCAKGNVPITVTTGQLSNAIFTEAAATINAQLTEAAMFPFTTIPPPVYTYNPALPSPTSTSTATPIPPPTQTPTPTATPLPAPNQSTMTAGKSLSFDILSNAVFSPGYDGNIPNLRIIDSEDEISPVSKALLEEDQKLIRGIDFQSFFVVVIFQGEEPGTGYEVLTQSVTLLNNHMMFINAVFKEPKPGEASGAIVTHPYEIIKISKEGLSGEYQFVLTSNGRIMAKEIHEIK